MAKQDWTVYACETVTGRIAAEIPFVNVSQFGCALNDPGSGSVTVPLGGNGMSTTDIDQLAQPWRWSWVICYRQYPVQGGPVVSEQMTDTQSSTTVTFAGMWKVFSKRLLFPAAFAGGNPAVATVDTTYSTLTYRQIVKNIVSTSMARGSLPIVLPADDFAGTNGITYFGFDLNIVADMLVNVAGLVSGPEIEFRPQFSTTPGYIQWLMRVGSSRLGQIGSSWVWDYGPRGAVTKLDYARDGSSMTFSDYVRGSGSQYGLIVGNGQNLGLVTSGSYPLLEDVDGNHTTVTDLATANSYALTNANTFQYPVITLGAEVRVDGLDLSGRPTASPTLDQILVGDTATFNVQGHRRIPNGTYTYRITGITQGSSYDTCVLVLQPTAGTV